MARQGIDIGVQGNDGTGDSIREAFRKVNENFRDLYAVFGEGDLIKSTSLDDFPSSYSPNQVFVINDAGDAILAKDVVGTNGITIDNTDPTEFRISAGGAKLSGDLQPSLGAPLNANTLPIGRVGEPTVTNVNLFNSVYGTSITIDDLALTKGYADRRYLQQGAGGGGAGQIRIRTEPVDQTEYTKTIEAYQSGNIRITGHGYDTGSDGIAFKYFSTGAAASGLVIGTTYYLKYVNPVELSIHPTFEDAKDGSNKIIIATGAGSGVQTLVDAFLDPSIPGNFLTNEALPRISTVRRQGDVMDGPLYLSDHPSPLNISPIPSITGADLDFQAATKYYVDNNSFASQVNLYVSSTGTDSLVNVPPGKKGSALAYAYATIGAACARAEELIDLASQEPGPYRQKITYTVGTTTASTIQSAGYIGGSGFVAVETLLGINRDYIRAEVIGFINATYPSLTYNSEICSRDVGIIIDAVIIDTLVEGNWQSINAGKSYFKNASARVASGAQQLETIAGIAYAKSLADFVLQKIDPPTSYQSVYTRQTNPIGSNSTQRGIVADKFDIVIEIVNEGVASAPVVDYGTGVVSVVVNNGGAGNVDQGLPTNIDIIPGKLIRGLRTGAVGVIVSYASGATNDTINCNLLTPFNFEITEELEFAEANKISQITVLVESGIYNEDYPIRVPANVTIRGDDFRRCIIRPRDRASQSPWIETYFYRDTNFDGIDLINTVNPYTVQALVSNQDYLKREVVAWINAQVAGNISPFTSAFSYNQGKCSRDVGLIVDAIVADIKFGGNAETYYAASLYYNGVISKISGQEAQTAAAMTQLRTIINSFILTGAVHTSLQTAATQAVLESSDIVAGQSYVIASVGSTVFTSIGAASNSVGITFTATATGTGSGTVRQNTGATESAARTKAANLLTATASVITSGLSVLNSAFGPYDSPKYGYHYLEDGTVPMNTGTAYSNAGSYFNAAKSIENNKLFIEEEVVYFINATYPSYTYSESNSRRDTGSIVDAIVADLQAGGKVNVVDVASRFYNSVDTVGSAEFIASVNYINTLIQPILNNTLLTTVTTPPKRGTVTQIRNLALVKETNSSTTVTNLISTVIFAFDPAFNPPKNNKELDVFMFNDAVRVSNITAQGHGGFMCVLDPAGAVGSKSPYVQESACFSASINAQAFRGGMFIDGFAGRLITNITSVTGGGLTLTLSGLTERRPIAPTAFYYNGFRYQVDNVASWNALSGVAVINLNPSTPWSSGNLNIILETPGNRSMLANDFTQVNDLGYGIVAHNTGLTEQVSTFTYYCHTAYFASRGGQIRSVAGSNANGNFGLRALGADPTEIPDQVTLTNPMTQVARIHRYGDFSATNLRNDVSFYLQRYSYIPEQVSEVEIDHNNGTISRYELRSVTKTGINSSQYTYRITNITKATTAVVTVGGGALPLTITGITRADPCVITVSGAHNLVDRDFVDINNIVGMTQLNGGSYYIRATGYASNSFALYTDSSLIPSVDSTTLTTWVSGGTVSSQIKFYSGDRIAITGAIWNSTNSALNGNKYYVKPLTANTFELYTNSGLTTPVNTSGFTGTFTSPGITTTGSFVTGREYTIINTGDTNFTLIGASSNTPGTIFTATGIGGGTTGTAYFGGKVNEKFTYNISAISKANPCQVTFSESHHYSDGDLLYFAGVGGMTNIDGTFYAKANGANTVQLYSDPTLATPINSSLFSTYTSGGTVFGGQEILLCGISTNANDNREANGLSSQINDSRNISIRSLQNFRFSGVENVNPTRPSTALEFDATLPTVYRIIGYGSTLADGSTLPENNATLTSDTSFVYIKPVTDPSKITTTDPIDGAKKMGSQIGDIRIAIYDLDGISNTSVRDLINTSTLTFAWNGKIHRILSYTSPVGLVPAYITIADVSDNNNYGSTVAGINKALSTTSSITLRAGLPAGSSASITVKISTCRATGHDFLDIGTGGFNTTNYPTAIFGNPAISPSQVREVVEEFKGRVFYVSTDQNGVFRVGRFFTVDQGTGTVTFAASIALSNLDGIGFKRGVTVAEFSTDNTMTNNAADTVPVQSAIRGYIDKRLGLDHAGGTVPVPNLIGSGYMALNGVLAMKGNLNVGGNQLKNVGAPSVNDDGATKLYVDTKVGLSDALSKLTDMNIPNADAADVLMFTGGNKSAVSASITGDISASYSSTNTAILLGGITSAPTVDSGIAGTTALFVTGGIVVDDITGFPTSGHIQINGEIFGYSGITVPSNRFDGVTRAQFTTSGAVHAASSVVKNVANATLDLQIVADSIVNADVSPTALIRQNKLLMNFAGVSTGPTYNLVQSGLLEIGKWYVINTISNTDFTLLGAASNTVGLGFQATGDGYVTTGNFVIGKIYLIIIVGDTDFTLIGAASNTPGLAFTATGIGGGTTGTAVQGTGTALEWNNLQAASGLSSFNTANFSAAAGWVSIKDSGVTLAKIANIADARILGNFSGAAAAPIELTASTVGTKALNAVFTSNGALTRTGNETFAVVNISTTGGNDSLVRTSSTGTINVKGLQLNGSDSLTLSSTTINLTTPGGVNIISATGSAAASTPVTLTGQFTLGVSSTLVASSITGQANSATTTATSANTANTIVLRDSSGNFSGGTFSGVATSAQFADLAEYYTADQEYAPGTVLIFGGVAETTTTNTFGDARVAGVVSTDPGFIMNEKLQGIRVCLALQGRVPCKVVGKVKKGDMLTTAGVVGHAAKAMDPKVGTIIGKALEDKDYTEAGVIEVAVGRV